MNDERVPTYAELRNIVAELTAKRYEWEAKAYFERERGRSEAARFAGWVSNAYRQACDLINDAMGVRDGS